MKTHLLRRANSAIGPNAVTQLIKAAEELNLSDQLDVIFEAAQARDWLIDPPHEMVEEARVAAVHQMTRQILPLQDGFHLLRRAGELTGTYILAHRIPKRAQSLITLLPRRVAGHILTKAIRSHAWTFAGSGQVAASATRDGAEISVADNPLCRNEASHHPVCIWHEAVFTKLFGTLVAPEARALEMECVAQGGNACKFKIQYEVPIPSALTHCGC